MGKAEIDAAIDAGDLHLEALVALTDKMGAAADALAKLLQKQNDYERMGPVAVKLLASGTTDASGDPLFLDLGGPAYGRVWEIRQLVIGGQSWASSVAGNAPVLITPVQITAITGEPLQMLADHAASFPSVAFYSSSQMRLRHPEHLWAVILGGSVSTNYTAAGNALDVPDGGAPTVFSA